MSEKKLYNTFEIPGSFLVPGFCIYVLEIVKEKQKWFYIGMTGDPHYPSARSAYYRLVGHLELNQRSTQNQLRVAMKEKVGINNDNDFMDVTIQMHHYPIPGFTKLNVKLSDIEVVKQLKLTPEYKAYKKIQQQVLALENALIFELKDKLLNKTKGQSIKQEVIPFPDIYKSIIELVNNG
ncbi:MAG: hypothetical protein IPJ03_00955 [Ignavibacteriales bacterium]|nr:hypothetical protein [Ignavibacteriales bacterium]